MNKEKQPKPNKDEDCKVESEIQKDKNKPSSPKEEYRTVRPTVYRAPLEGFNKSENGKGRSKNN